MRKRLDFYIDDALQRFANWYVKSDWLGKERDCVNLFALQYLTRCITKDSAIKDLRQIRIECPVPQPRGRKKYPNRSAAKDLVIWDGPLDTAWNAEWKPVNVPRAVIEWKTGRSGNPRASFDKHDEKWVTDFTRSYKSSDVIGFLVSTHATKTDRCCRWALVRGGKVGKVHLVSKPI